MSKDMYYIDPDIVFLNHGSFGGVPKEVFQRYQNLQLECEMQPMEFMRKFQSRAQESRRKLCKFLNAPDDCVVFTRNVSESMNIAARALNLRKDDEVLGTSHVYVPMQRMFDEFCFRQVQFKEPIVSQQQIVDEIFASVTEKTKVIFASHIASCSAMILPVKEICKRAREMGLLSVIDGAHAPGQIPVDLLDIDADFYGGNNHKWLSAPKSSGFLYVKKIHQKMVKPLIISWSYKQETPFYVVSETNHEFVDMMSWTGTLDASCQIIVGDAVDFQRRHEWKNVQRRCFEICSRGRETWCAAFDVEEDNIYPTSPEFFAQMVILPLPKQCKDASLLKERLWKEHKVEIVTSTVQGKKYLRMSIQAYNSDEDVQKLVEATKKILAL